MVLGEKQRSGIDLKELTEKGAPPAPVLCCRTLVLLKARDREGCVSLL